jgi:hypothetical protein
MIRHMPVQIYVCVKTEFPARNTGNIQGLHMKGCRSAAYPQIFDSNSVTVYEQKLWTWLNNRLHGAENTLKQDSSPVGNKFNACIEAGGSIWCSQEPAIGQYPEAAESSQHSDIMFL